MSFADDDIRAVLPWRLIQPQRNRVRADDEERARRVCALRVRFQIAHAPQEIGVRDDDARSLVVEMLVHHLLERRARVLIADNFNIVTREVRANRRTIFRVQSRTNEHFVSSRQLIDRQNRGFGGSGRAVVMRRVRRVHPGQRANH